MSPVCIQCDFVCLTFYDLNKQLQNLHWCAIAHGLVHADFRPANLGLTQHQQLKLLDSGGSTSSVCFEKLPKSAANAVLLCLQQLTQGVIDEAVAKLGHKRQQAVGGPSSDPHLYGPVWPAPSSYYCWLASDVFTKAG